MLLATFLMGLPAGVIWLTKNEDVARAYFHTKRFIVHSLLGLGVSLLLAEFVLVFFYLPASIILFAIGMWMRCSKAGSTFNVFIGVVGLILLLVF